MEMTEIFKLLISLCFAILTCVIVPYLRTKYGQEKINESLAKINLVRNWIQVFVTAAEQLYPSTSCIEKKQYVMSLIEEKLLELNIIIDAKELNAEVEASVLKLHSALDNRKIESDNSEHVNPNFVAQLDVKC